MHMQPNKVASIRNSFSETNRSFCGFRFLVSESEIFFGNILSSVLVLRQLNDVYLTMTSSSLSIFD